MTDRTETRQEEATNRAQGRQDVYEDNSYRHYGDNYYGGGYYDDDDDGWDGGEVAAVALGAAAVGYVVGSETAEPEQPSTTVINNTTVVAPAPVATLPGSAEVVNVGGSTYYRSGGTYYQQAYGPDGVTYVPVPAP